MTATDLLAAIIAEVRKVGLVVVDDLDGRASGLPPECSATLALERPVDADGVLLDTRRVRAELRAALRVSLRRGQAWAEMRVAEYAHRLTLRLPEIVLGAGVGGPAILPPRPSRLTDSEVVARTRVRLVTPAPERALEHGASALEALRAVSHALMLPRAGVDEVTLPSSFDLRVVATGVGLLEADFDIALNPLRPEGYREAHAAIVGALRDADRRVTDDGSGRVADLLAQRDHRCADIRLQSYAGWVITADNDAVEARAVFPVLL